MTIMVLGAFPLLSIELTGTEPPQPLMLTLMVLWTTGSLSSLATGLTSIAQTFSRNSRPTSDRTC